ncbi:MAG TPA: hypothetical protein DEA40_11025 [Parvularcula sp.]|nr:hypothetical protein [Parvularcula sp.]
MAPDFSLAAALVLETHHLAGAACHRCARSPRNPILHCGEQLQENGVALSPRADRRPAGAEGATKQ